MLLSPQIFYPMTLLWFVLWCSNLAGADNNQTAVSPESNETLDSPLAAQNKIRAHVIPVREQIGPPTFDILRRGLKDAILAEAEVVILDMETPGGELGVTLEIMEALDRFDGKTIVYVNKEAISAGAYISIAADEIAFAPTGIIGAAEAVSGGGQEIDPSMKRKINSYLKAKIRAHSQGHPFRARVMTAMMDANATLEIEGIRPKTEDGTYIQNPGELLSLTANDAIKEYGEPPLPLLGIGIFDSIEDILSTKYGENSFVIEKMELSWSEDLGLYLNGIAPVIMGIGMLLLIIEFKTPGFGIFGVAGIILMLIFFGSKYVAGLAGSEEILIFLLGVSLVFVEIFLFPGTLVFALLGILSMAGALLWAMADVWPTPDFEWSIDLFVGPSIDLGLGLLVAIGLGFSLARILPKSMFWDKLILANAVGQADPLVTGGARSLDNPSQLPQIGAKGRTTSHLFPSGTVEINGSTYQAQVKLGSLKANQSIRVIGHSQFNLVVEVYEES
tara:strand:- start:3750 stop:5258 length:1509 start_codon:yes stop_codon:yes gene_type:complete